MPTVAVRATPRRLAVALTVVAGALPVASAGAQSAAPTPSDANLRTVVQVQETRLAKHVQTFRTRSKSIDGRTDIRRLRTATSDLVQDSAAFRRAAARQRGETTATETGRIHLLGALTRLRRGFSDFRTALDDVLAARSNRAVDRATKDLKRAGDRIDDAAPKVDAAVKEITGG